MLRGGVTRSGVGLVVSTLRACLGSRKELYLGFQTTVFTTSSSSGAVSSGTTVISASSVADPLRITLRQICLRISQMRVAMDMLGRSPRFRVIPRTENRRTNFSMAKNSFNGTKCY